MLADVAVADQAEWTDLAGTMAHHAVLVDERRDVARERVLTRLAGAVGPSLYGRGAGVDDPTREETPGVSVARTTATARRSGEILIDDASIRQRLRAATRVRSPEPQAPSPQPPAPSPQPWYKPQVVTTHQSRTIQQLLDLQGRVAIVTGGSRGLGLEIAEGPRRGRRAA